MFLTNFFKNFHLISRRSRPSLRQTQFQFCILNSALDYCVFIDEVVEEGIDGEAGDALDAGLAHDVFAVGGDCEDAHVEA